MTTNANTKNSLGERNRLSGSLGVSAYDQFSSMLGAVLVLVGFFVLLLFLMWLTSVIHVKTEIVKIELSEAGGRLYAQGTSNELEPPGIEELEEIIEPQLEQALEAVTDIASSQPAALEALEGNDFEVGVGSKGDNRAAGPGGEGNADIIPPWERWEIRFSSSNLNAYARQLSSFKIELAAIGGGNPNIDYAYNLTKAKPDRREGAKAKENRVYMSWTGGGLRAADLQLLSRAGIETQDRVTLQFYPEEVVQQLLLLERRRAGTRTLEEVRKTIFGLGQKGGKYEFYVIDQLYRK